MNLAGSGGYRCPPPGQAAAAAAAVLAPGHAFFNQTAPVVAVITTVGSSATV